MRKFVSGFFLFFLLVFFTCLMPLFSEEECNLEECTLDECILDECILDECILDECTFLFPYPNKVSIGPEIYHVHRKREGGSKQSGTIYGVRASYDRFKRYKLYWGADYLFAQGTIKGKSGAGNKLKSTFTDDNIEGRLGYTFQGKIDFQPLFTPYGGYGYLRETNKYHSPSPIKLKFLNHYQYAAFGFYSSITFCPQWTIGLNYKGRVMIHARCKVSDDPDFDDQNMLIGEKIQSRFELPIYYRYFCANYHLELGCVPFYEFRHYAGRENFPFDFLDTKLSIYGINLQVSYRF